MSAKIHLQKFDLGDKIGYKINKNKQLCSTGCKKIDHQFIHFGIYVGNGEIVHAEKGSVQIESVEKVFDDEVIPETCNDLDTKLNSREPRFIATSARALIGTRIQPDILQPDVSVCEIFANKCRYLNWKVCRCSKMPRRTPFWLQRQFYFGVAALFAGTVLSASSYSSFFW